MEVVCGALPSGGGLWSSFEGGSGALVEVVCGALPSGGGLWSSCEGGSGALVEVVCGDLPMEVVCGALVKVVVER